MHDTIEVKERKKVLFSKNKSSKIDSIVQVRGKRESEVRKEEGERKAKGCSYERRKGVEGI